MESTNQNPQVGNKSSDLFQTTPNEDLLAEISEILKDYPQALEFVLDYRNYIHGIDDIIDRDITKPEDILAVFALGAKLFSSDFYAANRQFIYPIEIMINNTYADSVEWEKSQVSWKVRDASVLRHTGIDMFLFVLRLVAGREAMRKVSSRFRAQCHCFHMRADETPI